MHITFCQVSRRPDLGVIHQPMDANLLLIVIQVELDALKHGLLLVCHWGHSFGDARDEDLATGTDHRVCSGTGEEKIKAVSSTQAVQTLMEPKLSEAPSVTLYN